MTRCVIFSILLFNFHPISAQIYEVEVNNLENLTSQEKKEIKSLINDENTSVYVFSSHTDSILFRMINDYRESRPIPLPRLDFSIRLDTLARIVAYQIGESGKLAHYPSFPELKPIADLLNVENIAYNSSSDGFNRTSFKETGASSDILSLQKLLMKWINSPGHNRNLLVDLPCGSVSIILRIKFSYGSYVIETICVYEADNTFSKREADEKLKAKNKELITLPKRPKR